MDRRRFLRAAAGGASTVFVVSVAGCMGNGDDDSDGPQPVSGADDEDASDEVVESADHIEEAEEKLAAATTTIESDYNHFDGLIEGNAEAFEPEAIRRETDDALESLEEARDGATPEQEAMIEEMEALIDGYKEYAVFFEEAMDVVDSYKDWEDAVENGDIAAVTSSGEDFMANVDDAFDQLGTVNDTFGQVSADGIEAVDGLTTGRIDSIVSDADGLLDLFLVVQRTVEELESGVDTLMSAVSAADRGSLQEAHDYLLESVDAFDPAIEVLEEGEYAVPVKYESDVQALLCVAESTQDAGAEFAAAIDAYIDGDQMEALDRLMVASDMVGNCSYDLLDQHYDAVLDEFLDE